MKTVSQLTLTLMLGLASSLAIADKTAGDRVDDSWLHTKVKTALVGHGSAGINIEVYHGVVQLAGFVDSQVKKQSALDAVGGVKGVEAISDRLILAEPGRTAGRTLDDNTLAARVKGNITDADFGEGLDVNVEVNRGRVLLSGFVDNVEVRSKVVEMVEGLEGVEDVINGLDLKS